MATPIFTDFQPKHAGLWGRHPVRLRHDLHTYPLFSDDGLAGLIDALPPRYLTINTMAEEGHHLESWSRCDRTGLSGSEVLQAAKNGRLWINMRKIEEAEPRFRELLERIYDELNGYMPDFATFKRSCGLLISSPKAQVFYHADIPGQSLWQIRGRKRLILYPQGEPFLTPEQMEGIVRGITEEEIAYEPWYEDYAVAHDLEPGDMIHWPLNGPHRVTNYDCLNVSITTEHWTPAIRRSYAMNYGNGVLRSVFGWTPRSRALSGPAFWAKVGLTAFWRMSGVQQRTILRQVNRYRVDPAMPGGIAPLPAPNG